MPVTPLRYNRDMRGEKTLRPKRQTARKDRTATKTFGTGAREGHDASAFYERFDGPALDLDTEINPQPRLRSPAICGDSRRMKHLSDRCVALVVTSPPYFAGKDYETPEAAARSSSVPRTYGEYLEMLHEVFAECERVMEPGGRIAVNVANLGRKPYRSLSADVMRILEDIGFFLRAEIIWLKAEGAGSSCAWGSFRSAANPVLRDLTERVIVASKSQFGRALNKTQRKKLGLPHEDTITAEEFMEATLDVWRISPESATKVGHPAPFPVDLPARLINLYTYTGDLVLDPFMGSGTTLVAARRLARNAVGYDTDQNYVDLARRRLANEKTKKAKT